jgi:hypothetical protein
MAFFIAQRLPLRPLLLGDATGGALCGGCALADACRLPPVEAAFRYVRLNGKGNLYNTRTGWASAPRWGERQRRWFAALLPPPEIHLDLRVKDMPSFLFAFIRTASMARGQQQAGSKALCQ